MINENAKYLLQAVPPTLAVVAAVIRLLPGAATSVRSRAHSDVASDLRVASLRGLVPWQDDLETALSDTCGVAGVSGEPTPQAARLRVRTLRLLGLVMASAAALTIGYVAVAVALDFVWWSWALAAAVGLTVVLTLGRKRRDIETDPQGRPTWALPQTGRVQVSCHNLADVKQYALFALSEMGTRVVWADEGTIVAAAGVGILGRFAGDRITVTISDQECGQQIEIRSLKLDFATPSRSRKNVAQFVQAWAFAPLSAPSGSTQRGRAAGNEQA